MLLKNEMIKKDELKKFDISHLDEELNNLFKSA